MLIKDAIDVMARSPALKFPWVPSVVEVINAYLPVEHQITDVPNISADLLKAALDQLPEETRELVNNTNVTLMPEPQVPVPPVVALPTPPAPPPSVTTPRSAMFMVFGIGVVLVATIAVSPLFGRLESTDLVAIIKILAESAISLSGGGSNGGQ